MIYPRGDFPSYDPVPSDGRPDAAWAAVAVLAVVLGLVVRLVLLQKYYLIPDGDQSVLGLMARHILLGDRPVFYWGQSYTGSGEAYVAAALFGLFGQSNFALHLVPLAASTLFTVFTAATAWRLYGPQVGALTCVFLAVGPTMLVDWSFWAGSGYLEAMAAGSAALLLVLAAPGEHLGMRNVLLAFFLLGLAVWIQPTGAYYSIAVLAALACRIAGTPHHANAWVARIAAAVPAVVAFCAGAAPLLLYNLQHNGATLAFLSNHATSLAWTTVFARALLWAGPVLLGFLPPTTDRTYFLRFILDHLELYGVALVIVLMLLFRAFSLWRLALRRVRVSVTSGAPGDLPLVALALAVLAGYLCTGWGGEQWSGSEPRYLLPLYSAVPLIIRIGLPLKPACWQCVVAWAIVLGIAGADFAVNTTTFGRTDVAPLATLLESRGIKAVYGDYWLVYPLMFAGKERVIGVAVGDDLGKGDLDNRYSPYLRIAAGTASFAWIAGAGSARERSILLCLTRLGSQYTRLTWQNEVIFLRPSNRAFPWWNGGRCPTAT